MQYPDISTLLVIKVQIENLINVAKE